MQFDPTKRPGPLTNARRRPYGGAFEAFPSVRDTIYAVVMKDSGETLALSGGSGVQPVVNGALEGQAYLDLLRLIAGEKRPS